MLSLLTLLLLPTVRCPTAELPPEQTAILNRLRGPVLGADEVQYRATITMPMGDDRPLVIVAAYQVVGLRCTMRITEASRLVPFLPSPLAGSAYVWEPGSARLTGADAVEFKPQPASPLTVDPGKPPWDFEFLAPYLFAAATLIDPASFTWHETGEKTDEGWEVFGARLREPLKPTEPHTISGYRYYFDTTQDAIVRVVGLNSEGQSVYETVYSDLKELPDGSAIPLSSTTTVAAGEAEARVIEKGGDVPATAPCAGLVITTDYEWFDTPGIRLPLSRDVRDHGGRLLCSFTFYDHRVR